MNKKDIAYVMAVVATLAPSIAHSTTFVVYDSVTAGQTSFDSTVALSGGTLSTQVLSSATGSYTSFTMSKTPIYTYPQITGTLADIAPFGSVRGPSGDSRASGIAFNFSSAINSFGLNVGDWGTCCYPSSLYIAFDDGAPILVGTANSDSDAPRTNGDFSMFVGAFDDAGTFSKVEFWGDGFGEVLYAGGTIRSAAVDVGSLPPAVPEPAAWAMMIVGMGMVGAALRRRIRVSEVNFTDRVRSISGS